LSSILPEVNFRLPEICKTPSAAMEICVFQRSLPYRWYAYEFHCVISSGDKNSTPEEVRWKRFAGLTTSGQITMPNREDKHQCDQHNA
jgi:hypothetical protein